MSRAVVGGELRVISLDGCRDRLQAGTPAALTNFIGIDEIVGSLAALGAFDWHGPGHTANVEPASPGLTFNPFAEFPGDVSPGTLLFRGARFIGGQEERSRTQPQGQAYCNDDRQGHENHVSLQIRSKRSRGATRSTYALRPPESLKMSRFGFQLNTSQPARLNLATTLACDTFERFMTTLMLCFRQSCQIIGLARRRTVSFMPVYVDFLIVAHSNGLSADA